ncbi:MAG TPA: hypothetical protein PKI46_00795 [Bacteroidales bacterium]|nr:hypothetical protein [Bacteroidales bacterium]
MVTDDAFKNFANQIEMEEEERAQKKLNGGFTYDKLKWVGIPKKGIKIIRALGEAPNSHKSKFTARTYHYAKIKADDGRDVQIRIPLFKDNNEHIMWRIINSVLAVEWNDNKKTYINETRYPEIFNMVKYNKLPVGHPNRNMNKGWSGQEMFVMNCIDRDPQNYAWSKENKHSVLLSKNINIVKDASSGKVYEFIEPGVPAYGFIQTLAHNVFAYYGDWKEYDIKIQRTGTTTSPYIVTNASKHIEEVPADMRPYVVNGSLTEEESSWEMYDLDKYFGLTSYSKIFKRLSKSIMAIDVCLGTHYFEELKSLSEEEMKQKKDREIENNENEEDINEINEDTFESPPVTETVASIPVRATRQASVPSEKIEPVGIKTLTEEERKTIVSYKHIKDNTWDVLYEGIADSDIIACSVCNTPSPSFFAHCPGCGATF